MLGLSLRNCGYADRCSSQEEGDADDRGFGEGFLAVGDLVSSCFTGEPGDWDVGGKKPNLHLRESSSVICLPQRQSQTLRYYKGVIKQRWEIARFTVNLNCFILCYVGGGVGWWV